MFKKRTLFILGAGASHEFGLPLGTVLARTISERLKVRVEYGDIKETGDADLLANVFDAARSERNEYLKAFRLIQHGVQLCSSIDDFLDVHAKDEHAQRVGKIAIVKSILETERNCRLYFDKSNIYNRMAVNDFEDTWLVKCVRILARGLPIEQKEQLFDNIAFIVFNYDRCLEHVLYHAIQQLYFVAENVAADILKKLSVIHPYGVAAPFKTQQGGPGIPFGGEPYKLQANYWALSEGIRTYTEQIQDPAELHLIHNAMQSAERIVFLGFAFHEQNMNLLKPPGGLGQVQIFGTAKGMSDSDVAIVRNQLMTFYSSAAAAWGSHQIYLRGDLTCAAFFDAYSKSLPA